MTKAQEVTKLIYQLLKPASRYVGHRLALAEKKGLIKPGFYQVDDVVDEALIQVFKQLVSYGYEDETRLKISFFQALNQVLNRLIKQEAPLARSLSIEKIYEAELKELFEIERLTVDAEGEIVFAEEIDEKEYPVTEPTVWILENDLLDKLIKRLDLDQAQLTDKLKRKVVASRYVTLKPQARVLVGLVVFGELELEEAAEVVGITLGQAKLVVGKVKDELVKEVV